MSRKKQLVVIFLLLIILPVALSFANFYLSKSRDNVNTISLYLFILAIFGCFFVIYKNHSTKEKAFIWLDTLCVILALLLIAYLFIGYSISNFGF